MCSLMNQKKKLKNRNPFFIALLISIIIIALLISVSEILIKMDVEHENKIIHDALFANANVFTQTITQNLYSGILSIESLYNILEISNFKTDNFEIWAKTIFQSNKNIHGLQLAPDGIVTYVYPYEEHKKAIGHDLLSDDKRRSGAIKAIASREMTVVGPIKLIQNGKYAIIARKPVFIKKNDSKEKFWGFVIALIYIDQLLPSEIFNLEKRGISFRLTGDDPDADKTPIFVESNNYKPQNEEKFPIYVPNGKWNLLLSHEHLKTHYSLFRLLYTLISIVILYISFKFTIANYRRRELEEEQRQTIKKLKDALENIETLRGLMPICSKCKKIRDDQGYWNQIEDYFAKHSDVQFSHSLCEDCANELYHKHSWYKEKSSKSEDNEEKHDRAE